MTDQELASYLLDNYSSAFSLNAFLVRCVWPEYRRREAESRISARNARREARALERESFDAKKIILCDDGIWRMPLAAAAYNKKKMRS